jgi:hypothetical protein
MFKSKSCLLLFVVILALVFMSCAPGNENWNQEINPGNKAGFWAGIWHGAIIIVTFIVSLFTNDVGIYEINNTGWPYNLGFIIGLNISIGGMFSGGKKKCRKK